MGCRSIVGSVCVAACASTFLVLLTLLFYPVHGPPLDLDHPAVNATWQRGFCRAFLRTALSKHPSQRRDCRVACHAYAEELGLGINQGDRLCPLQEWSRVKTAVFGPNFRMPFRPHCIPLFKAYTSMHASVWRMAHDGCWTGECRATELARDLSKEERARGAHTDLEAYMEVKDRYWWVRTQGLCRMATQKVREACERGRRVFEAHEEAWQPRCHSAQCDVGRVCDQLLLNPRVHGRPLPWTAADLLATVAAYEGQPQVLHMQGTDTQVHLDARGGDDDTRDAVLERTLPWYARSDRQVTSGSAEEAELHVLTQDSVHGVMFTMGSGRTYVRARGEQGPYFLESLDEGPAKMTLRAYGHAVLHHLVNQLQMEQLSHRIGELFSSTDTTTKNSEIEAFVHKYNISVEEVRGWPAGVSWRGGSQDSLPAEFLNRFTSFNGFFARELKANARVVAGLDNAAVLVSPGDCRMHVYPNVAVDKAWRVWIKSQVFSLHALLGDAALAERYVNGSLVIARLAPQDYHRIHAPVDGVLGSTVAFEGSLYSVNPYAVTSPYYTPLSSNKRVRMMVHSERFGDVAMVAVGATLVGSIVTTAEPGQSVRKGDELMYFAYGGSTVVLLFEHGRVAFDTDLVVNSGRGLVETYVQMGERVGEAREP